MENELVLKNNLKEARAKKQISQRELAANGFVKNILLASAICS